MLDGGVKLTERQAAMFDRILDLTSGDREAAEGLMGEGWLACPAGDEHSERTVAWVLSLAEVPLVVGVEVDPVDELARVLDSASAG